MSRAVGARFQGTRVRAMAEALSREADETLEASTRELLEAGVLLNPLSGKERVQ